MYGVNSCCQSSTLLLMALNSLLCADVPLRNCSLNTTDIYCFTMVYKQVDDNNL